MHDQFVLPDGVDKVTAIIPGRVMNEIAHITVSYTHLAFPASWTAALIFRRWTQTQKKWLYPTEIPS